MIPVDEFRYASSIPSHAHAYLSEPVIELLLAEQALNAVQRVFDLGCGNGAFSDRLASLGFDVVGVDVSTTGIEQAQSAFHAPRFAIGSAYDDLQADFGQFDVVLGLEVVEHLYSPRKWAATIRSLLRPGGLAIVSTPYHGYWKNLALSLTGRWDSHIDPLWDHGHIKLWSVATLSRLLAESGLEVESVRRVGRLAPFAKSMVMSARG